MKKFIILAVAAMSVMSVSAQKFSDFFSTEKSNEKITFGVRAALNVMGMKNNVTNDVVEAAFDPLPVEYSVHKKAGISIGVNVDIPILKNLWVNTGLYYNTTGAKLKFKRNYAVQYDQDFEYNANLTMHNIRIPAQASYRYNINPKLQIEVNLGPYFSYGIAGKASVKSDIDDSSLGSIDLTRNKTFAKPSDIYDLSEDVLARDEVRILGLKNINTNKSNYINPFDMGIAFGSGVTYKKKYYAGFNYDGGLVNVNGKRMVKINRHSIKNHSFTLVLGYNF